MPVDNDTAAQLANEAANGAVTDLGPGKGDDTATGAPADGGSAVGDTDTLTGGTGADTAAGGSVEETPAADPDTLDTEKWGSTGNETGDAVLLLLQKSGMEPDTAKSILYDAVVAGDPTKINRDTLVEKLGADKATLVLAGVENYIHKQQTITKEITTTVHAEAGGKQNWDKVAKWARENVSDSDRADLNAMLDAGGVKAKFAAQEYVRRFNADTKNTSITTSRIEGEGKAPENGRAIDRRTYFMELDKAHRNKASQSVIKEIQAARERGRKRGL